MEKEEKERLQYDENGGAFDANGFIVMKSTSKWALAADRGQSRDHSAICIIEQVREPLDIPDSGGIRQLGPSTNFIRKIKRVPRGTEYADVLNALAFEQSRLPAGTPCWVDVTGNRAIRELANNMGVAIDAVQMTSGSDEFRGVRWNELGFKSVSKSSLVFALQASLERGELKIPDGEDGDALVEELSHYQMVRTVTGQATWKNVGVANDDLCVATALANFALVEAHDSVSVEMAPWLVAPTQAPAPKNPVVKTNEQLAAERSTILVRG